MIVDSPCFFRTFVLQIAVTQLQSATDGMAGLFPVLDCANEETQTNKKTFVFSSLLLSCSAFISVNKQPNLRIEEQDMELFREAGVLVIKAEQQQVHTNKLIQRCERTLASQRPLDIIKYIRQVDPAVQEFGHSCETLEKILVQV